VIAAREAGRLDGRVIVRATVTRLEPGGLLAICLCSECEARRMRPCPPGPSSGSLQFVESVVPRLFCVRGIFLLSLWIRCVMRREP